MAFLTTLAFIKLLVFEIQIQIFGQAGNNGFLGLIFNDAISQPFYPAKMFPRSETVDLQKGEVEWRGGNLYFDRWEWELLFEVKSN